MSEKPSIFPPSTAATCEATSCSTMGTRSGSWASWRVDGSGFGGGAGAAESLKAWSPPASAPTYTKLLATAGDDSTALPRLDVHSGVPLRELKASRLPPLEPTNTTPFPTAGAVVTAPPVARIHKGAHVELVHPFAPNAASFPLSVPTKTLP